MQTDESLAAYYARRAPEFEAVYARPERQPDLRQVTGWLEGLVRGQDVLEVACGTGYWTQVMARSARSLVAADINAEVLALARAKAYGQCPVTFLQADAWSVGDVQGSFTAGVALFWWSHMARSRTRRFLAELHRALLPGALVILADNLPLAGAATPISRTDAEGNTYQERRLRTGERFEVMKNYPSEADLRAAVPGAATALSYTPLSYYWLLSYRRSA